MSDESLEEVEKKPKKSKLKTILIALFILFVLRAIIAPSIMCEYQTKPKRDTVCLKMKDLEKRLDMFKLDNDVYPETYEGFQGLISNPDETKYKGFRPNGYFKKIPKDSWNTPFEYRKVKNGFELISYGRDRKRNTEEDILFSVCNK